MQVFIMRHGDAAVKAASDAVRPLTQCGRDESLVMGRWLKDQAKGIERILVSPYLRAQQTLDIMRQSLSLPVKEEVMPELTPCGNAAEVKECLQQLANEEVESVLVVSHLPLVGYLVAELCPQETAPMFSTSAIAKITLNAESGQGTLDWKVSPCNLKIAKAM